MGLGPPVCKKCMVIYEFKHSYGWECPVCKTNDGADTVHLFALGILMDGSLEKVTEQLEANRRFYDFMMKEDGGDDKSSIDGQS